MNASGVGTFLGDEKPHVAMCVHCRRRFTEDQIAGAKGCPACGNAGVPADPRKTATITLTHHEWRLLGIWAHNWGEQCAKGNNPIDAIVGEIRSQMPDLPPLTMGEEFAGIKKLYPTAEMIDEKGNKIAGGLN